MVKSTKTTNSIKTQLGEKVGTQKKAIPRPPNSFMLWSASNRKNVQAEHPDSTNADISRFLGIKWNEMSIKDKKQWQILAEEKKQIHSKKYPGYKYQPKTTKPKTTKPKTTKPKNILKDEFIDGSIDGSTDGYLLFQLLIESDIY